MPDIKPERVKSYRVTHPYHGKQLVSLINPKESDVKALAVIEAARRWGVQWGKVLQDCKYELLTESWQCVCGTCKQKFISDKVTGECTVCIDKRRQDTFRYMKRNPVDRRINAGK